MTDDTTSVEEHLKEIVGEITTKSKVVIERGPVSFFADAVLENSPIYKDPNEARKAGLPDIPGAPTYCIGMEAWGKFPEIQSDDPPPGSPIMKAFGPLMAKGGIILHGEQEFIYHRPIFVGDVLVGEGKIVEAYQKESKGKTMTFVVTETNWVDEKTGEPVVTSLFNVIHRG
ncbi:MAG: MaoC family dehydratase N-terminal domain-containing protein [Actinobacteria bacterium]|nr:MaoC family dehydratase N-terminal domain-containing protein [Actinomycetota bacterium]MCL5445522.1 MaoC family dehydratase N-terminal domain-containing protein [Actinomycetota bacterium]